MFSSFHCYRVWVDAWASDGSFRVSIVRACVTRSTHHHFTRKPGRRRRDKRSIEWNQWSKDETDSGESTESRRDGRTTTSVPGHVQRARVEGRSQYAALYMQRLQGRFFPHLQLVCAGFLKESDERLSCLDGRSPYSAIQTCLPITRPLATRRRFLDGLTFLNLGHLASVSSINKCSLLAYGNNKVHARNPQSTSENSSYGELSYGDSSYGERTTGKKRKANFFSI